MEDRDIAPGEAADSLRWTEEDERRYLYRQATMEWRDYDPGPDPPDDLPDLEEEDE